MKKVLFFAFALVASILAFTSCDKKDEPAGSTEVNPADYIKTEWRIDSCYAGGEKQRPPHGYIRVLSDHEATFNGDTAYYEFKDGKLVLNGNEFTIVNANKTFAHLLAQGEDIYLSKLPEWEMDMLQPTAANLVGTWKMAYYSSIHYPSGESPYTWEGSNPWVETWEFKADGTCIYKDYFTGETRTGTWGTDGYSQIKFEANPATYSADDFITVQPLTKNWLGLVTADQWNTWQWFLIRVK